MLTYLSAKAGMFDHDDNDKWLAPTWAFWCIFWDGAFIFLIYDIIKIILG